MALTRTILLAVPNVGQVHVRQRYKNDIKGFRDLFMYKPSNEPNQLRGWMATRTAVPVRRGPARGGVFETHILRLYGFMSANDEGDTETVFQSLVEAVQAAFESKIKLGDPLNATSNVAEVHLPQVDSITHAWLGDVFVHYAVMTLRVVVQRTVVYET